MRSRLAHVLGLLAMAAVLASWFVFLRPGALGGPVSYIIVRGTSMLPTFESGDLVIARSASQYRVGDVVAYRVPAGDIGAGLFVIHRIIGVDHGRLILRGDNNQAPDPWQPRLTDVVGGAWLTIPGLGRALALLHQPAVLAALAASGAVGIVVAWQPRRRVRDERVRVPRRRPSQI